MSAPFVHLHTHSEHSLLDATCRIDELLRRAADFEMPALALTDHGTLSGLVGFYRRAKRFGVKPILGCELYLASGSRHERGTAGGEKRYFHLLVLAESEEGYRNLIKLSTLGYLEGFYYRPRVDKELLRRYGRGLIATSGCRSSEIPRLLLQGRVEEARRALERYVEIFGEDRFYIELQDHGVAVEGPLNEQLRRLAAEWGLPLVATNDVHYLDPADREAHEVLLNVQRQGSKFDPEKRRSYDSDQYYFKSPQEMAENFPDDPQALENTLAIAERCTVELELGTKTYHLPAFKLPEPYRSPQDYLEELAFQGARQRYGRLTPQIEERLKYELSVIRQMDYAAYFLIVQDFVRYAKSQGIPVGPGRGSSAGSVVTYCLGITDVDPFKYGLLFERFLNPARISLPDIDIDFCERRRDEVLRYVEEKYGVDHVAQIVTSSTMKARGAVRDVARVLGFPFSDADQIAKLIPFGATLDQALERSPQLRRRYEEEEEVRRLIDISRQLEGLARNASTHAAGVVITPGPIDDYAPLQRLSDGSIVTQYDMKDLEAIGLLKMDFLGLRTLTVLDDAIRSIRAQTGRTIKLQEIPLDDPKTYALLQRAQTVGVFQLEGSGMRELVKRLRPTEFNDLIALLALYRPGPLESGMADDYVERKHGRQKVTYPHPDLEEVLKDTYGLPIYQDQVMQMAQVLAGFSLAEADTLRYAIGKKVKAVMETMRDKFIQGCMANGIPREKAAQLFADIEKFSRYGFVRAHSTAYALISYWTAYFKANHPTHYMAALLSSVAGKTEAIAEYINECKELGLVVRPPDINESGADFTPYGEDQIAFGLGAVKNVGRAAVLAILEARGEGFRDFFDFCRRVDLSRVNREVIESLIKVGAFDRFAPRKHLLSQLEAGLEAGQRAQEERRSGQRSFFGFGEALTPDAQEPATPADRPQEEFPPKILLQFEKELLGLYVSGHPLEAVEEPLRHFRSCTLDRVDTNTITPGQTLYLGGRIAQMRAIRTQKGAAMAFLTLEDLKGEAEITVFPQVFERCRRLLRVDQLVAVVGRAERRKGQIQVVAEEIQPLEALHRMMECHLRLEADRVEEDLLHELKLLLEKFAGETPSWVHLESESESESKSKSSRDRCSVKLARGIRWTPEWKRAAEALLGEGNVRLCRRASK